MEPLLSSAGVWLAAVCAAPMALPGAFALRLAHALMWVPPVMALTWWLCRRRPRQWAWAATLAAGLWTAIPGGWSLGYWLGMAFQLPSWTSVLLAGSWLLGLWRGGVSGNAIDSGAIRGHPLGMKPHIGFNVAAVLLGALLCADTWVLLPALGISPAIYAWGFAPLATAALLGPLLGVWAWARPGAALRGQAGLLVLAVALHVATRLPSGNVFDALIDPWLWALALAGLVQGLRRRIARPG